MPTSLEESPAIELSPEQIRVLILELHGFTRATRDRGLHYASNGHVQTLEWRDDEISARVRGTRVYEVTWAWNDVLWEGSCTCPVEFDCKHQYAVACRVLAPYRVPILASDPPPRSAGDPRERPPFTIVALRSSRDSWSRSRALGRLLDGHPRLQAQMHRPPVSRILSEPDSDLMCWFLARVLPRLDEGWLPPALEPYRDRPDLEKRYVSGLEEELTEQLSRWALERPPATNRNLRFLLSLALVEENRPALAVEARLTSLRLRDAPRTVQQLEQLLSDARRNPGRLPIPQVAALGAILAGDAGWSSGGGPCHGVTTTTLRRLLEIVDGTRLLVWHDDIPPRAAERFGIEPGAPVRRGDQPVTIVPECELRDGKPVLDLFVRWPDGRRRPIEESIFVAGPRDGSECRSGVVVAGGELHWVAESPPEEILDSFSALGGLRLKAGVHTPLLERMARRFPDLRESLVPFARVCKVSPVVALDVREDDWMQIRVFAAPKETGWSPGEPLPGSGALNEYTPQQGWTDPTSGTPGSAPVPKPGRNSEPDTWFELLDDAALEPAVAWLERTGAHDGTKAMPGGDMTLAPDRHIGWWMHMGPRRMAMFAAAWESRPAGLDWYCTPRAKRLLMGGTPVRPVLSVRKSGVDFLEVTAEWEAEGTRLTDQDLALLRDASGPYVRISSGWVRREVGEIVERTVEALADLGLEPGGGGQRLTLWQLAQARPESLAAFEEFGADRATVEEVRKLRERVAAFCGLPHVNVPAGFQGTLRPYQQTGLDFLAYTTSLGVGAVLADDMGLGKTVQALAWLLWLRNHDPDLGPALVVCPASVVHNWEREARSFAPSLRVALATSGAGRTHLIQEARAHDLLVTNYALLRRDIALWSQAKLGAVLLDEAQFIKNPDAAVSRAACQLGAKHRLALTGTPLENRALDLWSIMAFANPGLLGPRKRFGDRYDRPNAPAHLRRLLAARLRPVLLRRMKSEVAKDLPPRVEERRDCELLPAQRKLYAAELLAARREIKMLAADPRALTRNKIQILARLTRLRQICCHPALVGGSRKIGSGKFDGLWEVLEPLLAEGHKVLLFSQFVRCLELLQADLRERGIGHHLLTGDTKRRGEVVAAFEADEKPCVFLISLRAGGTGLNLTAASYVILFDPWWNPAVEAQAIDRTHRIGQTRTVIAYRMLTRGTIEEKIWELQERKAALAREVLGEDGFARGLTREDLAYLLEDGG